MFTQFYFSKLTGLRLLAYNVAVANVWQRRTCLFVYAYFCHFCTSDTFTIASNYNLVTSISVGSSNLIDYNLEHL